MIRNQVHHRRSGFTLVEILVVIGLILLLTSLAIGTLRNAVGMARQRQTEATILKVHGLIQQRIDAFNRAMDRLNLAGPKQKLRLNFGQQYNVYLPTNSKVLDVLVRKQLFQSRFPQNFAERNLLAPTSPTTPPHQRNTESAALLYWIVTGSEVFGIPPVDDGEFSSAEVRDTDGDGLLEFIDGWGRPLRFYRWPTQLIRPGGGTNAISRVCASALWSGLPAAPAQDVDGNALDIDPLVRDPDDQTSQLYFGLMVPYGATVSSAVEALFSSPSTYHAFLIVSPGPDGILGLGEPFDYLGTDDPSQAVPTTTTNPALAIPAAPAVGASQGRLAGVNPKYSTTSLDGHPINDNPTNRKR